MLVYVFLSHDSPTILKTNIRQTNNVIYLSFWQNILFNVIHESMYKNIKIYKWTYLKICIKCYN